jgi:hypothetical protein
VENDAKNKVTRLKQVRSETIALFAIGAVDDRAYFVDSWKSERSAKRKRDSAQPKK